MIEIKCKGECSGCGACATVCPTRCISMNIDSEGFRYPNVDQSKCIDCGKCDKACQCQNPICSTNIPEAFACYNLNREIQTASSSGGVFTLLAEWILQRGGVVFGAAFDENLHVNHVAVENRNELYRLRGSKYLQSEASGVFPQVKRYLDEGRYVLFTGTPCQVDGLLHTLNRDYERLITQDIICHGVPSDKVWQEYLSYQIGLHGNTPLNKEIHPSFRCKTNGWSKFSMRLTFEDGTIYDEMHGEDLYMKLFLRNISLRPSCYQCCSKTLNRNSDITLADFWGIENVNKDMYDGLGTSLVLVNSDKGRDLFGQIVTNLRCTKVDVEKSVAYNPSAFSSVSIPYKRQRKVFFRGLGKDKFDTLAEKSVRITLIDRISYRIRCILEK